MTLVVDTVTGYPELFYFKKALLLPKIKDNVDLFNRFNKVELYKDKTNNQVNYEDLLNMTDAEGNDPTESSLFNLTTLKALLAAGDQTIDIIAYP